MPQILVRDLDPEVVEKLKHLAKSNKRSLQAEVKDILTREATTPTLDRKQTLQKVLECSELFAGRAFPDSADLSREERDH